jgi:8-oxo-dGTP diphosphatase
MKTIHVVAAVIKYNNKILCVQRGENKFDYISKKWEFPGGKIEDGESKSEAIKREIFEELKMEISVLENIETVDHSYPDFRLIMDGILCEVSTPELTLTEHIAYKWLDVNSLVELDWAAADIPIVNTLIKTQNAK